VSCQIKAEDRPSQQGERTWFYYGKPGHIARFCYKAEDKERENAKNAKAEDKLAFALQHKAH
jgi:hypothetical protein